MILIIHHTYDPYFSTFIYFLSFFGRACLRELIVRGKFVYHRFFFVGMKNSHSSTHTLKVLIFARANFRENLFSREFIFAIQIFDDFARTYFREFREFIDFLVGQTSVFA